MCGPHQKIPRSTSQTPVRNCDPPTPGALVVYCPSDEEGEVAVDVVDGSSKKAQEIQETPALARSMIPQVALQSFERAVADGQAGKSTKTDIESHPTGLAPSLEGSGWCRFHLPK